MTGDEERVVGGEQRGPTKRSSPGLDWGMVASRTWGSGTAEAVSSWSPENGSSERLRFGTYLAPSLLSVYEAVTEHVGRRLGIATELVVETSYESCENDENEVCFVCSLPYVLFERRGLDLAVPVAAPVLEDPRYEGRPIYYSDVIVGRDGPFRSFGDLRGRSWAYNEPMSHSGYGITRYHLVTLGETDGFFGEVVEAGFHEEAIRMVARGEVDGSAIDSHVLAIELRDHPALAERLRVVGSLGPSTIQPIAVSKRVPEDLREVIRGVLVTMHGDSDMRSTLGTGLIERFVPVDESSYDDIRMMLDACERIGFLELR